MITIKEIAEQLGVSSTTVSNVLHGKVERMSPETRKKIEMALVEHHYYKNETAREGRIPLIVVAFDTWGRENIVIDPFFGAVLGAIEQELRKYGRGVIFSVQKEENQLKRLLTNCNVEGAVLVAYPPEVCEEICDISSKPVVFIDSGRGNYSNIGLQDREGAYEITSYLLKLGHRKLAFFCDQEYPAITSNARRLQGFCDALEAGGISFVPDNYFYLPAQIHVRHEILRQFARTKAGKEYTAAVFVSDLLANEGVNLFAGQGIAVPDDISVTGFDDNIYASLCTPALTTVRQIPSDKGREAVRLLMKKIKGEIPEADSLELPTELIVRNSVRHI
jgi:LacI family transcriptional regulator